MAERTKATDLLKRVVDDLSEQERLAFLSFVRLFAAIDMLLHHRRLRREAQRYFTIRRSRDTCDDRGTVGEQSGARSSGQAAGT